MNNLRRAALLVCGNLALAAALIALLEGSASLLFAAHEIWTTPTVPEHGHAEHDDLLGWVNRPNVALPDYYGPGEGIRTNTQRFRNDRDFAVEVPPGRTRVVCSGDSFTFAYHVNNDDAWCERLVALDPRLQTVNMGLGGYGVDQAYLWYRRDGVRLDHDLQIFAFVTDDFDRMRSDRFMGYGKPLLAVSADSLVVTNRPVPETSWLSHRRALHSETLGRLNVVRLARRLSGLDGAPDQAAMDRNTQELRDIVARVFTDLVRLNEAKGSQLVLVYFPGTWDYQGLGDPDGWRAWVTAEARRQNIPFLDLVEEIRHVPPTGIEAMYQPNGHFTVSGNAWAARVLYAGLRPFLPASQTADP